MEEEPEKKPVIKKIKKTVSGKSFRLIDFNTYDQSKSFETETTESGSNDDDSVKQPKYKPKEIPKFVIQMFGLNEKGETCCIYIDDFAPFFFVKVADDWTKKAAAEFLQYLKEKVGKYHAAALTSIELINANKLYGFTAGKTDKFVKITFKNTSAFNKTKNFWFVSQDGDYKNRKLVPLEYKGTRLEIYESFLPPLLRYFHIQNVSPSGWVFVKTEQARIPEKRTTTCNYEYICKCADLKSQPEKMVRVPYKICSFDIEASSSHGDFPLPKKTYKRLATQLVDTFIKMSRPPNPQMDKGRAALLLKKAILTAFGNDRLEDIDLVYPKVAPSKEKLLKTIELLQKTPLKQAASLNEEEDNRHLLEIDKAFERIKEGQNAEFDGEGDGDLEPIESSVPSWVNKPKTLPKSELSNTLVDVLLNDKVARDAKIDATNDVLTMLFPRLEGDKVTFIGSTFLRYGEPEPYLNHCIVLGSCDPVDGAEILSTDSELDLLLQWSQLIQRENPDIIIGYNIFGFDYEFLFRRAEENNCEREFLKLSRKEGEVCGKPVKQEEGEDCELNIENPPPIKLATGEYHMKFIKMTGRLQIDLFIYFRRNFNMPSYKLDDVAGQNISDDIKRIEHGLRHGACPSDVTELFTSNIKGLHVGDFIHIEISGFTSDYYKNGQKFKVLQIETGREVVELVKGVEKTTKYNVITIQGHEKIDMSKHIKWGMAKDDVSPADIFRLANGSSADRAIVAKYCIQDCNLVHHLMNKIDLITGYSEMSTICSVPISFLVFRGQSIKLTSFVAKKCREKNTLMPDLQKSDDKEGYEGAIVLPPKCSMYMDDSVACVDYSSLYPSSMISQNFSHDSKVWVKEYNLAGELVKETGEKDASGNFIYDNLPEYKYIDIEFDNFKWLRDPAKPRSKEVKTKVGKFIVRWAQLPAGEKSILPAILEQLLSARASTRKMIKVEPDPFMQNILEKRQLGYKETANSLYGQCGAQVSAFYEKDVAACTTATGRMMITYAKRIVEEVYGDLEYDTDVHGPVKCKAEYVYGDTDSVFFTFNLEDVKTGEKIKGKKALEMTIEIAQDAAQLCSKYLKPPMELSYEKTLMPFILLSKKRYVGMLYETDANKGKMKYMGLAIKRRDSCDYLKDVYGGILNILMGLAENKSENKIQTAIDFLNSALETLISGRVPMDKLTMTRQLRSEYKNPDQIAHNVLANRIAKRDPGNKPKSGDRMKYLVVCQGDAKDKLGQRIETPEYIIEKNIPIDYLYYIENQLMEPLKQLFGLALEQIWKYQGKNAAIKTYKKDIAKLQEEFPDLETFMKKKEKHCSKKIEELLFKKFLTKIDHEKKKLQNIAGFFAK